MAARRKSPEHSFQCWADRFIDRVVEQPMFTSAIDVAGNDLAKPERRRTLMVRGYKFGLPDLFVCQSPDRIVWLELKRGSAVTSSQAGVHVAMQRTGQTVFVCRTMSEVLGALKLSGFKLHPNAGEMAREYELRAESGETAPRQPKAPRKRAAKASPSDVRRVAAAGFWSRPA